MTFFNSSAPAARSSGYHGTAPILMARTSVFGIVGSQAQAEQIIDALREGRFANDDISVLFPDPEKVHEGNILVSVHAETFEEVEQAKRIFASTGAEDVCTTGEASSPNQ